jgi:uncharacterized membrane protein
MRNESLIILALLFVTSLSLLGDATPVPSQDNGIIIDPITVTIHMYENTTSNYHITGYVNNTGTSSVTSLTIRIESQDLGTPTARTNGSMTTAAIIPGDRYVNLKIDLQNQLAPGQIVSFEASVNVYDLQSSSGVSGSGEFEYQDFIYYVRPASIYRNFSMTAVLPQYATLSEESVVPLFPRESRNFTDGQSLAFTWLSKVIFPGQEQAFIIKYQIPMAPESQSRFLLAEFLIVGLVGLAIGAVITYYGPRVVKRLRELSSTRIVGITNEEEDVLEIIRKKGGSCPQKDLYTELDFSQAKVSIVLNNLEERGLVRRFRDGRENMVHIIEK